MNNKKQNQPATKIDDLRIANHFRNRFGASAYAEAKKALPNNRISTKRVLGLLK